MDEIQRVKNLLRECGNREHIEERLKDNGFSIVWEDEDDYVWENKDQTIWIFISWINAVVYVYKRVERIEL